ncbi:MAG: di-trans,poly-cis-decaprenylcistransferase [Hyphomicrobiaceae bacterium]
MQSNLRCNDLRPLHVALIMDGNGRWAKARELDRSAGHYAGVAALRAVAQAAPDLGIATLTVYAFSADNWRRPHAEVAALFALMQDYLSRDLARLVEAGVRLDVIGRRDRLPDALAHRIAHAERVSAGGTRLHLRIAIDYSARAAIVDAARRIDHAQLDFDSFADALAGDVPDVDLLIRTSGEQRLSDFMLWEAAYAELYFTDCLWPDFGPEQMADAIADYRTRERRFGGLAPQSALSSAALPAARPVPAVPVAASPRTPLAARALAFLVGAPR